MKDIQIPFPRLEGEIRLIFIDRETGRTREITKSNLITNAALLQLLNDLPFLFTTDTNVGISTYSSLPAFGVSDIPNTIAIGFRPSGVPNNSAPTFIDTEDPIFGEIASTIEFAGSDRTFRTVLLTNSGSIISTDSTVTALAYTRLDVPLTQKATEILRVFYQIKFPLSGFGVKPWVLREMAKQIFYRYGSGTFDSFKHLGVSGVRGTSIDHDLVMPSERLSNGVSFASETDPFPGNVASASRTEVVVSDHFKNKKTVNYQYRNIYSLGMIINSLYFGLSFEDRLRVYYHGVDSTGNGKGTRYTATDNNRPPEPRQVSCWHTASGTSPFFEDTSPNRSERGQLSWGGTWNRLLPVILRIEIVTGGAVGTATYRVHAKRHTGFFGNSYNSRPIAIPWRQHLNRSRPDIHGWRSTDADLHKWDEVRVVQYDSTGVTLLNLWDGTYRTWNNSSTPALGATAIGQVCIDRVNNRIWVGCRQTGIWRITFDDSNPGAVVNQVTNPIDLPCFGLDVAGTGSTVYAILDGRLTSSASNFNDALPFSFSPVTAGGNWFRVRFFKGDRYSAGDRLAIVYSDGVTGNENTRRVAWRSTDNPTVTLSDLVSVHLTNPASLANCPEDADFWVAIGGGDRRLQYLTHGSTTVTIPSYTFGVGDSPQLTPPSNTLAVGFWKNGVVTSRGIFTRNGTLLHSPSDQTRINRSTTLLHWDTGIFLLTDTSERVSSFFQVVDGVALTKAWTGYGWNGSNWVAGGSGAKTTHAVLEPLIEGITVAFSNREDFPNNSYVTGEYLTQPFNYGLLKSNFENIVISWQYYTKNLNKAFYTGTIPSSSPYTLTLPASLDIDFIRVEIDSPDLHEFLIAGSPITRLRTDGIAPAPNEITLNGNGTMTFNSSDMGKTITGSYFWIGN
jgi:hypothetical protein